MNSNFLKKMLFLVIILIIFVSINIGYKKFKTYSYNKKESTRREEILKGVNSIFKQCSDITSFESRRSCFRDKLLEIKKNNKKIKKEYVLILNNKKFSLKSFEEEDLLKIEKPKDYGFTRCLSNTFFFDWVDDFIYISMDNELSSVSCKTTNGLDLLIVPKDLKDSEINSVKSMFMIPIK